MSELGTNITKHRDFYLESFNNSGWDCLNSFVESDQFDDIIVSLYHQYTEGNRFTP